MCVCVIVRRNLTMVPMPFYKLLDVIVISFLGVFTKVVASAIVPLIVGSHMFVSATMLVLNKVEHQLIM